MVKKILSIALAVALSLPVATGLVESSNIENNITVSAENNYNMKASYKTIELIKSCEGFSSMAYWDYKQWTIGYGTYVESNTTYPNGITVEQAEQLLYNALEYYEDCVNSFLERNNISVTQDQFDALLCFTYALPSWSFKGNEDSSLAQMMINGWTNYSDQEIYDIFGLYVKAGNQVLPGLVRRRAMEASLFLYGDTTHETPTGTSNRDTTSVETTTTATTEDTSSTVETTNYTVTDEDGIYVRDNHNTDGEKLGILIYNTSIQVSETVQEDGYTWGKISYKDTEGWCALDFCTKTDSVSNVKYDVNGDGTLSFADICAIKNYIDNQETLSDEILELVDIDGNGYLDMNEYTEILKYYSSYAL